MATPVHELDLPEVDLFGLEREEGLAAMRAARERHWLVRMPMGYAVTRYDDAVAVLRDRRWHSATALITQMAGISDEQFEGRQRRSILSMEGPEHARLRRLVAPAFTPKAADRLRPFMREVVGGLFDKVAAQGTCELVEDVCEPYPIPIICELLGAPKEDWKLFSQWATDIFRIFNDNLIEDLPIINAAFEELDAYVRALVDERRGHPRDDLLSDLIALEEEGDKLSPDELVMMSEAVLMAGTDTTRNQLACSVALLSGHPDQWAALAAGDLALAQSTVEETMRHLGAVRGTARFASEDIEYRDVLFPTGMLMAVSLVTANFDPEVFGTDESFDITHHFNSAQLTFGSGIHYCLGAALARAELQEALPLLARRMPDMHLDGEIEWKPSNIGIWGPAKLPLAFTPA
ncbi:MAG TPA: cytochrome P450 [Acidimicrobiales bacterium]|nr:cytochrome P450 [Acidimicrobiales bacterium]